MTPVLLLLMAAVPAGVELLDETVQVAAGARRSFTIELRQRPAVIQCQFEVLEGAGVRVVLVEEGDGAPRRMVAATGYQKSGGFRFSTGAPGDFHLVVDNRRGENGAVRVRLAATLMFDGGEAVELSPKRRLAVILISAAVFAGIVAFVTWRLGPALWGRPPEEKS